MARGQTDRVRIRVLVLVASILWGRHRPMGTENDEHPDPSTPSLSDQGWSGLPLHGVPRSQQKQLMGSFRSFRTVRSYRTWNICAAWITVGLLGMCPTYVNASPFRGNDPEKCSLFFLVAVKDFKKPDHLGPILFEFAQRKRTFCPTSLFRMEKAHHLLHETAG